MIWTIIIAISLAVIAGYIIVKAIGWISFWIAVIKIQIESNKRQAEDDKAWKDRLKQSEEFSKKWEAKKQKMRDKGYEPVSGADHLWIEKVDGKIVRLYNLDGKRVPLAELAETPYAETIGVNPILQYAGQKIYPSQMMRDEREIDELNGA